MEWWRRPICTMSFFSCLRFSPHPQQSYTWPESCSKMLEDPTYFCFRLSLSTGLGTLLGAGITGDIYTREVTLMVCYHCVCLTTINMVTHNAYFCSLFIIYSFDFSATKAGLQMSGVAQMLRRVAGVQVWEIVDCFISVLKEKNIRNVSSLDPDFSAGGAEV